MQLQRARTLRREMTYPERLLWSRLRGGRDAERTAELTASGLRVVRYTNDDVLADVDAVVEAIVRVAAAPPR